MNAPRTKTYLIYIVLVLIGLSCQRDLAVGEGLRKLSREETLYWHQQKHSLSPYIIYKQADGTELTDELRERLNSGELMRDYYADEEGEIVQIVVRELEEEDELWAALYRMAKYTSDDFEMVEVSCGNRKRLLRQIYKRYSSGQWIPTRWRYLWIDQDMSYESRQVLSSLFRCGFPDEAEVSKAGLIGLYHALIRSNMGWVAAFYPQFKERVDKGELPAKYLAYMEDIILATNRREQIYGTYHGWDYTQNKIGLTPIRDSVNVDKRRAKIGLEPLAEQEESYWAQRDSLEQLKEEPRIRFDREAFGATLDSIRIRKSNEQVEESDP